MLRVIAFLIVFAFAAAGAAWLARLPGVVTLATPGVEFSMRVGVAIAAVVVIAFALVFATRLLLRVAGVPKFVQREIDQHNRRRGLKALGRGFAAVAAGDAGDARRCARLAEDLLDEPSLTRLLSAQAAQLSGDDEEAERKFSEMLGEPNTEFLAVKGLYLLAAHAGDQNAAHDYAARAFDARPTAPWAFEAVYDLALSRGAWGEARNALNIAERASVVAPARARRERAALLAADAQAAEAAGDDRTARREATRAAKLAPDFAPAAVIAARRLSVDGRNGAALRVLERAWSARPHPEIAEAYAALGSHDNGEGARHMLALAGAAPDRPESRLLAARQHVALGDWAAARGQIEPLLKARPTAELYGVMADIAAGETGDEAQARVWLARAVSAPRAADAHWRADLPQSRDAWDRLIRLYGETGRLAPEAVIPAPGPAEIEAIEHDLAALGAAPQASPRQGAGEAADEGAIPPPPDVPGPKRADADRPVYPVKNAEKDADRVASEPQTPETPGAPEDDDATPNQPPKAAQ